MSRAVRAHLEPLLEKRFYVHAFLFQRRDLPRRARYPLDAQSRAYAATNDLRIELRRACPRCPNYMRKTA